MDGRVIWGSGAGLGFVGEGEGEGEETTAEFWLEVEAEGPEPGNPRTLFSEFMELSIGLPFSEDLWEATVLLGTVLSIGLPFSDELWEATVLLGTVLSIGLPFPDELWEATVLPWTALSAIRLEEAVVSVTGGGAGCCVEVGIGVVG